MGDAIAPGGRSPGECGRRRPPPALPEGCAPVFSLRQVQYFVAVAENGSLTRAAHQLSISLSTLTEAVHALERDLRLKLVERHPRGVQLTLKGQQFLRHATKILADVADLRRALAEETAPVGGHGADRGDGARRRLRVLRPPRPLPPRPPGGVGRRGGGRAGVSGTPADQRRARRRGRGAVDGDRHRRLRDRGAGGLAQPAVAAARPPPLPGGRGAARGDRPRAADRAHRRRDRGARRRATGGRTG